MMPIDFQGTNITFCKPESMTDEQCSSLRAYVGTDKDGYNFILVAFQPNKEDVEAINAGRPVMLKIMSTQMHPIALYTYDENYEANV